MGAIWARALMWVAMLASLAPLRSSAGDPPRAAARDRLDAEMLLELDLLADPRFDRRPSVPAEGASRKPRDSLDDLDLVPDFDESRIEPGAPGR
jgi:hypothetical protein